MAPALRVFVLAALVAGNVGCPEDAQQLGGGSIDGFCSKDRWCWEHALPQGNDLNAAWGTSARDVWAVGAAGTTLHFDGTSWSRIESGTTRGLNDIWGASASSIYAVGDAAEVITWDGRAWSALEVPTATTTWFFGVSGTSSDDVWIAGTRFTDYEDVVLHFDGSSWTDRSPGTHFGLHAVWTDGPSAVWAAGGQQVAGGLIHWNGERWDAVPLESNVLSRWPGRFFGRASDDLWSYGKGTALHFDGRTWTETATEEMKATSLTGMWSSASDDVLLLAYGGDLFHWNGRAWAHAALKLGQNEDEGFHPGPVALWGESARDLWAVGRLGMMLHFDGEGWSRYGSGRNLVVTSVWASSTGASIWAVGAAVDPPGALILRNSDGAWFTESLDDLGLDVKDPGSIQLVKVFGLESGEAYAVDQSGTILRWDRSDWSVTRDPSPTFTDLLFDVWASSPNDVWIAGEPALHFDGLMWSEVALPASAAFVFPPSAVWGSARDDVWMVGDTFREGARGELFHFDGVSWSDLSSTVPPEVALNGVWGTRKNDVYIAGGAIAGGALESVILHFDGVAWTVVERGSWAAWMEQVWGTGPNDVWSVGLAGSILHFDGVSWSRHASGASAYFTGLSGFGADVWAVGGGAILHLDRADHLE